MTPRQRRDDSVNSATGNVAVNSSPAHRVCRSGHGRSDGQHWLRSADAARGAGLDARRHAILNRAAGRTNP